MPKYGLLSTGKGVINAIFLNFWKINQFYKVKMVVNIFQILAISGFFQLILMAKSWSWAQIGHNTIDLNVSFTLISMSFCFCTDCRKLLPIPWTPSHKVYIVCWCVWVALRCASGFYSRSGPNTWESVWVTILTMLWFSTFYRSYWVF